MYCDTTASRAAEAYWDRVELNRERAESRAEASETELLDYFLYEWQRAGGNLAVFKAVCDCEAYGFEGFSDDQIDALIDIYECYHDKIEDAWRDEGFICDANAAMYDAIEAA